MAAQRKPESEAATRVKRIDPRLVAQGWTIVDHDPGTPAAALTQHAVREYPTDNGPADYALFVGGRLLGILEAKKTSVDPQNVLVQAERYARGAKDAPFNFHGYRVPFLYATNGEEIWFRDVRSTAELSRKIADFHTPRAVSEMLARDLDAACATLAAMPNDHPRLRPYQKEGNAAVEQAIAQRKRKILHAMATGTGKTFTTVNLVYRLLKTGVVRRVPTACARCAHHRQGGLLLRSPADRYRRSSISYVSTRLVPYQGRLPGGHSWGNPLKDQHQATERGFRAPTDIVSG
jgi:type I restriction enzyme R subunit